MAPRGSEERETIDLAEVITGVPRTSFRAYIPGELLGLSMGSVPVYVLTQRYSKVSVKEIGVLPARAPIFLQGSGNSYYSDNQASQRCRANPTDVFSRGPRWLGRF